MRVLPIDQGLPLISFAGLKQKRRASRRKGKGFETEHAAQLKRSLTEFVECHRHEPVCRFRLRHTTRTTLAVHPYSHVVMEHQQPVACDLVSHVHWTRRRLPRGARAH